MARILAALGGEEDLDGIDSDVLAEAAASSTAGDAGSGAAADLHSELIMAAQQELLQEQHSAVHKFHHHIPRSGRHGSGAGIIWLLIMLHVAFIAYWGWIWWRQRMQRETASRKSSVPQKVNCIYDWTPVIPQITNINKTAQH